MTCRKMTRRATSRNAWIDVFCRRGVVTGSLLVALAMMGGQAVGQTVQLPVFSNFTWRGAVSVPDGGSIHAAGVKHHAEGAISRGVPGLSGVPGVNRLFRNQAIGRETGSANLQVRPQILIMSELEQDHLNAAGYSTDADQDGGTNKAELAKAAFLTRHIGRRDSGESFSGPPR